MKVLRKSVTRLQHHNEEQIGSEDRRDMNQTSEGRNRIFKDLIVETCWGPCRA